MVFISFLLCSVIAYSSCLTAPAASILIFFAFIPVAVYIAQVRYRCVLIAGFMYGVVSAFLIAPWMTGFTEKAIFAIPILNGIEMMFLMLALKVVVHIFPYQASIVQAIMWVVYEYLSECHPFGFPYGNVGYALIQFPLLIQIADITGVWGLVFIAVFPNAYIGNFLVVLIKKKDMHKTWLKKNILPLCLYFLFISFSIIYGLYRLNEWNGKQPDVIWSVVAIQHNHYLDVDMTPEEYFESFKTSVELTKSALEETNPDVLVWSESSMKTPVEWYLERPEIVDVDPVGYRFAHIVSELSLRFDIPMIVGGSYWEGETSGDIHNQIQNSLHYNSAIFLEYGKTIDEYCKQRLVPFSEAFPLRNVFPAFYEYLRLMNYATWTAGKTGNVLNVNGIKVGTPICFEDSFGYISAGFVQNGADVLINLTNDAWSKSVMAEWQHAYMSVLRSIETRRPIIRCTNSGITCMISPVGHIEDPMTPFTEGWRLYKVPIYEDYPATFYVRHPDLFSRLSVAIAIFIVVYGLFYKQSRIYK